MAFYDEKDDQDQEAVAQEGQPVQTGQGSSTVGTAGGPTSPDAQKANAAASAPAAGQGPNTFAGIQDYVKANKEQTAKLANDVGGLVTNYGTEARSQLGQGQEKFNQEVDQNTVNLDERVFNTAKTNATQVANNATDLQTFQNMRDAEYKGPQSLETWQGYQPIKQSFDTAKEASDNTQTDVGQRQLLGQLQQKQRGKINTGTLDFNAALLQGDLDARGILDNAKASNADLEGLLTNAQKAAASKAQAAGATTAQTKQAIQDAFTGDQGVQAQMEALLKSNAANAVKQSQQQAQQTVAALQNNADLTPAQIALLGITPEQYKQLKGDIGYYNNNWNKKMYQDLSGYATQLNPETQITAQNIASADDYAKYAALNTLMGTDNGLLRDPSQAGTANMDALDFNFDSLNQNVQGSINAAKTADAQRAAEEAAARQRQAEKDARAAEERATATGAAVGFAVAGPVGAVVGAVVCFLHNTPMAMADGTFKMVQDIELGDEMSVGGMVVAAGKSYCNQIVEYKGRYTSPNHAVFDGNEWKRAKDVVGSKIYDLDVPVLVYPIVNEKHIMLSDNGTVYADLIEHDDSVGMSDADKLVVLNQPDYITFTKKLEQEIQWTSVILPKNITLA